MCISMRSEYSSAFICENMLSFLAHSEHANDNIFLKDFLSICRIKLVFLSHLIVFRGNFSTHSPSFDYVILWNEFLFLFWRLSIFKPNLKFEWDLFYLPIGEIKPKLTPDTNDEIKTTKQHCWTITVRNFLLSTAIFNQLLCVLFPI